MLKRIQLSLQSKTACCMTSGGTTHAHTAREHVGSFSRENWTLRRMQVAVRKGADSPKLPQERGLLGRSHADKATPTNIIRSSTSRRMQVCLRAVSIEELRTTVRRSGVSSGMCCNLGSERNVVQRHGTPDEAGAVFWQCTA